MPDWERGVDRIAGVTARGHDVAALWTEVAAVIGPLVPNYMGPCCFTLDPASLLVTSHVNPSLHYLLPEEVLRGEVDGADVHDLASVARSASGLSTIHDAAGGDPTASPRWQGNLAMGGDQEMIVALRGRDGAAWGALTLYREPGEPMFDAAERAFLAAAAPAIAAGLRRALLLGEAQEPDAADAPGLVVLNGELDIVSLTPASAQRLTDLPGGEDGGLPDAVRAIGDSVLRGPSRTPVARVRATHGGWVVLHGAELVGGPGHQVAVILEAANPARIVPLLMAAYGLTSRERDVTRLVLRGEPTDAIASALVVSPHTVQEHLKHVFEKTGVRSRRELVAKVFFSHYEPRLRDNEQRVIDGRPLRGGPAVMAAPAGDS